MSTADSTQSFSETIRCGDRKSQARENARARLTMSQCGGQQFDLANMSASTIDLLRNQGRALRAVARSARRNISAPVDANGRWFGIEIGLQHTSGARVAQFHVTMLMSVISASMDARGAIW
jgi:hypothetical protein